MVGICNFKGTLPRRITAWINHLLQQWGVCTLSITRLMMASRAHMASRLPASVSACTCAWMLNAERCPINYPTCHAAGASCPQSTWLIAIMLHDHLSGHTQLTSFYMNPPFSLKATFLKEIWAKMGWQTDSMKLMHFALHIHCCSRVSVHSKKRGPIAWVKITHVQVKVVKCWHKRVLWKCWCKVVKCRCKCLQGQV